MEKTVRGQCIKELEWKERIFLFLQSLSFFLYQWPNHLTHLKMFPHQTRMILRGLDVKA